MLKNIMPGKVRALTRRQQQQLACARNRSLAQQMEKRPFVQAAWNRRQSINGRLGDSTIQALLLGRPIGAPARGANGGRTVSIIQRDLPRGGLLGGAPAASTPPCATMLSPGLHVKIARGRGGFAGQVRGPGRDPGRRRAGTTRPALTKEQLDDELDAYMSKTIARLDADLDAYMAQAETETIY
ncbi:hypothetical protein STEG23_008799 [Scotinomys teguina]